MEFPRESASSPRKSAQAESLKIIQFEDLTPKKVKEILEKYGKPDGIEKKDS